MQPRSPRNATPELDGITERIIGAIYQVSNTLGAGYLEKVYERALMHELGKRGMQAQAQVPIRVFYDTILVGDFIGDILVEGKVLLELKAADSLTDVHVAQCLNYLAATKLRLCLLINFGTPRAQIRRVVR